MKIGSIAASSQGTIDLTYVPEYIYFIASTVPTQLLIDVLGDGTVKNLDGDGVTIEANLFQKGVTTDAYLLRLADGFIQNKNVTLTITNAIAGALDIYAFSDNRKGSIYYQSVQQKILASSGQQLTDFCFLGLPNAVAADSINVTYRNGHNQEYKALELEALSGMANNELRQGMMNFDQSLSKVNFIPNADQQIYLMRMAAARGVLNSGA